MPVAVQFMPEKKEKQREPKVDPMDQIIKGLSIASSIYGLKTSYDKNQLAKELSVKSKTASDLAEQNESQGILSNEKLLENTKDRQIVEPNAPNSMLFRRKMDGKVEDIWLAPKKTEKTVDLISQSYKQTKLDELKQKQDEANYALQTPYGLAKTKEDAKQLKDAYESKTNFDAKIDQMIALREKHGGGSVLNREDVSRGQQLSKDLLLEYKNMAKLGVLSVSDEKILNKIIPADPLEYNSPLASYQGQDPILNNLKSFKDDSNKDFSTRLETRLRGGGTLKSRDIGALKPQSGGISDFIQNKANASSNTKIKSLAPDFNSMSNEELQKYLGGK